MPTNGEVVYKTYAELHADKWAEVFARVEAEANADYAEEVARKAAKAKALYAMQIAIDKETARLNKSTASAGKDELSMLRKEYGQVLDRLSVTQGKVVAASGAQANRNLKAKTTELTKLDASPAVNAELDKGLASIMDDPEIVAMAKDNPSGAARLIHDRAEQAGLLAKMKTGTLSASLEQAGRARANIASRGGGDLADRVLSLSGFTPDDYSPQGIQGAKEIGARELELAAKGGDTKQLRGTAGEQSTLAGGLKERFEAAERDVNAARAYAEGPEFKRINALSQDEREADPGYAEFSHHLSTMERNPSLFRTELSGITSSLNERRTEVVNQLADAELAPRRKTELELLRETKAQFEPVYGAGGLKQAFQDTFGRRMPGTRQVDYAADKEAIDSGLFARNWQAVKALAAKGPIVIDVRDQNVGYKLFDTSKGALTPKQLIAKAKEAAGDDPDKLNSIIMTYMKKKLAADQTAQQAVALGGVTDLAKPTAIPPTPAEMMNGETVDEKARAQGPIEPDGEIVESTADAPVEPTKAQLRQAKRKRQMDWLRDRNGARGPE